MAQMVEEGLKIKKEKLAQEFREADQDMERNAEIELWDTIIGDGLEDGLIDPKKSLNASIQNRSQKPPLAHRGL